MPKGELFMEGKKERELAQLVIHASVFYRRRFDRIVAAASEGDLVTGRNMWVLRYLRAHEGEDVFQKDLETAFKVRRSTISRTVELMEQKGLLLREPVNGDARLKRLRLTPKAGRVLDAVSQNLGRAEQTVRDTFSPEEYASLMRLLERLCAVLEGAEPDQGKE